MASDDILEIKCPKCKKTYRYELDVRRSWVMELYTTSSGQTTYRKFTRLFTCPEDETDFEVSFSLENHPAAG